MAGIEGSGFCLPEEYARSYRQRLDTVQLETSGLYSVHFRIEKNPKRAYKCTAIIGSIALRETVPVAFINPDGSTDYIEGTMFDGVWNTEDLGIVGTNYGLLDGCFTEVPSEDGTNLAVFASRGRQPQLTDA